MNFMVHHSLYSIRLYSRCKSVGNGTCILLEQLLLCDIYVQCTCKCGFNV